MIIFTTRTLSLEKLFDYNTVLTYQFSILTPFELRAF